MGISRNEVSNHVIMQCYPLLNKANIDYCELYHNRADNIIFPFCRILDCEFPDFARELSTIKVGL